MQLVRRLEAVDGVTANLRAGGNVVDVDVTGCLKTALAAASLFQMVDESSEGLSTCCWAGGVPLLDHCMHRGMADSGLHAFATQSPQEPSLFDVECERGAALHQQTDLAVHCGDLSIAEAAYWASPAVRERLPKTDPSNAQ